MDKLGGIRQRNHDNPPSLNCDKKTYTHKSSPHERQLTIPREILASNPPHSTSCHMPHSGIQPILNPWSIYLTVPSPIHPILESYLTLFPSCYPFRGPSDSIILTNFTSFFFSPVVAFQPFASVTRLTKLETSSVSQSAISDDHH